MADLALERNAQVKQLIVMAQECLEIAHRCESARGYIAASGQWVPMHGPKQTAILTEERDRQYGLATECIAAIARLRAG